jgi:hypothetical protein
MRHNDGTLMGSIVGFPTAHWGRAAGIDAKLEAKNGVANALGIEAVPVAVNDGDDFGASGSGDVGADDEVLFEFSVIAGKIPVPDVGAGVLEIEGWLNHGFAVFFEKEDTIVQVIAILEWGVSVEGFRAP